jgi:glycine hydroxymethyltransferase
VWAAIDAEVLRQEAQLELIASENHASAEVIAAMGTALTNKYAEGYPGRRYYGGCEHVDRVEDLARDRAKELFGCTHANVQPHSGTQANVAALMALLPPGGKILSMSLDHGGHLSHGHPKNFAGVFYQISSYGVEKGSERIDMDRLRERALEVRPQVIIAGASAYSRVLDFEAFAAIAREVGAKLLVDMAHIAGPRRGEGPPEPGRPRRRRDADDAQDAARAARRDDPGRRGLGEGGQQHGLPGGQGGPLMHVIAAKAIALREALAPAFETYQRAVVENARALAEGLAARGLRIVSGGTDNHLMMVDVTPKGLSGKQAEDLLHAVDVTCNKNLIPYDPRPPMEASGIRLGTAAITTRGLGRDVMAKLAGWIADVLEKPGDETVQTRVRREVGEVARAYPIYR